MPDEVLLDTSVIVKHLRRKPSKVTERMAASRELYISIHILGELYTGVYHSGDPERELAKVQRFLQTVSVLDADDATARHYGRIAADLTGAGQTIPQNDMWIAAIALECELPIATSDPHFGRIEGLTVLDWSE